MTPFAKQDKAFYTTLLKITIPIALQNLISASLNMIDTLMIGQLGENEIAAVGLANEIFFLLNLFLFGICSGTGIFVAQFWGKGDIKNIRRVVGLSLLCGFGLAGIFTFIALALPELALGVFTKDLMVVKLGSSYLGIVGLSYVMTAVTYAYSFALRNTAQPKIPMGISTIAVLTNAVFNYLLIFGKLGFPAMGVEGAALATVIARGLELCLILLVVYKYDLPAAVRLTDVFNISPGFVKTFFKTTVPVILNEGLWALGVTTYSVIFARMGTGVVAAVNIAATVERMAMVFFIGMSHACAFMVGNAIGAGDEEQAVSYAKRLAVVGPVTALLAGLVVVGFSGNIISLFRVSDMVRVNARSVLIAAALVMPVRTFNWINIVGVLRGGGDTRFSLFIDATAVWCVGVPLGYVLGLAMQCSIGFVYPMVIFSEQLYKGILGVKRLVSRKWINDLSQLPQD